MKPWGYFGSRLYSAPRGLASFRLGLSEFAVHCEHDPSKEGNLRQEHQATKSVNPKKKRELANIACSRKCAHDAPPGHHVSCTPLLVSKHGPRDSLGGASGQALEKPVVLREPPTELI